jgi:hypothetical protein
VSYFCADTDVSRRILVIDTYASRKSKDTYFLDGKSIIWDVLGSCKAASERNIGWYVCGQAGSGLIEPWCHFDPQDERCKHRLSFLFVC